MTEACSLSFYFSHRLYFFLKAVISTQSSSDVKTECLAAISEIQQTCEYEKDENLLYLANSRDLVKHIKNLKIDGLYPLFKQENTKQHLSPSKNDNIIIIKERFMKIKSMIAEYNELGDKSKIHKASMLTTPLAAKDIILLPFTASINSSKSNDESESSPMLKRIDERKINAYLSTPKFIKYLTDISELIATETNKKAALKRELRKLNQYLPASVYIPFCQDSLRNYAVLHIPPDEVTIFQTKSRAPFMFTVELYRPDELSIAAHNTKVGRSNTIIKQLKSNFHTPKNEQTDYFKRQEPLLTQQEDEFFLQGRFKSNSVYVREEHKINILADQKVSNPIFVSFIGKRPDVTETIEKTQKDQHIAEKQVKKFLLDSARNTSMLEEDDSKISDEEESKIEYNNLSHQGPNSDDELINDSVIVHDKAKIKAMRSKTGGSNLGEKYVERGSSSHRRSFRKNSDSLDHYDKSDLNRVLSSKKEEELSFQRMQLDDARYSHSQPTNFLFKETFEQ